MVRGDKIVSYDDTHVTGIRESQAFIVLGRLQLLQMLIHVGKPQNARWTLTCAIKDVQYYDMHAPMLQFVVSCRMYIENFMLCLKSPISKTRSEQRILLSPLQ